jgi:hypothetical protein
MRIPFPMLLLAALAPVAAAQQEEGPERGRLRDVRITCGDVFDDETAERRGIANLVNSVHWETRTKVVRREVWMQPGEVVTATQAAELERNLRRLGLFAEVRVKLVAVGTEGDVDLEIVTRDRLSLMFGAGASYVGGVTGFRASIGESNLLGYGDRLAASFAENSEGDFRGSLAYTDLHVFDTWHTGTIRASRSDDGDSISLDVERPFKHLADPRSHGFEAHHVVGEVEYFEAGESVAQVDTQSTAFSGNIAWAHGPENRRRYAGFVFSAEDLEYQPATGTLAPQLRVPGDTRNLFAGFNARWTIIDGYRKVEGLDTIDYVQDLTLGLHFGATVGARWRDEDGAGSALQPEISSSVNWAAELCDDLFVDIDARASLRFDGGDTVGAMSHTGAWLFWLPHESNTIGSSATYDTVKETQDLPIQLTLGEDNGLRGYPAREFAGTERLRINLEDRYDTGLDIATIRIGAVAFCDVGWVGDDGSLGRPYRSAGVGLRIASTPLLGSGILRLDLAKPFDDVPGESDGWKLSVSVGQVFTFGGNANTLSVR